MMLRILRNDFTLACLSGVLLSLSFPKWDFDFLAWVGLVPLLLALEGKGMKRAFLLSSVTGIVYFTGIFHWVWTVPAYNFLDYVLLQVLYLPLYVSLWGLGLTWIRRRTGLSTALIAPPLWVALEYLRANLSFLSLPLMLLGHSQYQHPPLIQIVSLTGVYGLSFLIVLVNAAIAEAFQYGRRRRVESTVSSESRGFAGASTAAAGLLFLATVLFGVVTLSPGTDGEHITIALLHGNVSQEHKWDRSFRQTTFDRYSEMTRQAARSAPTLVIWPETAVQGDVQRNPELQRKLGQLAKETQSYLLIGHSESAKSVKRKVGRKNFNSVVLLSPEGKVEGDYRKMRLVPFGEYEPLKGIITWPKAVVSAMDDTAAGDRPTLFTAGLPAFGTTICWENIFPEVFREFVAQGARFMINVSDESWFAGTVAAYQFLATSVFRATENRIAVARATNLGISAFIDPFGRITNRRGPGEELGDGLLTGELSIVGPGTFYTRHGDVFAFVQITILVILGLFAGAAHWIRIPIVTTNLPKKGKDYAVHSADHTSSSA